jgi:hypothetical protein
MFARAAASPYESTCIPNPCRTNCRDRRCRRIFAAQAGHFIGLKK